MLKTVINSGVIVGLFTFLTTTDTIAIIGGGIGIIFSIMRIFSWFSERKKRNLEIKILEHKHEKLSNNYD